MEKIRNYYIPELLLPVGGKKQLIAAVEQGADAVYLGGSDFNARINAENFSSEELIEAVKYAHSKDVKIYVTLNTLLFDSELLPALKYACFLYEIGVDALIIQDFGLARLLRKNLPNFELHLSTQGSIYNLCGAEMAKELGFSRVVMARENTLEEVKHVAENSDIELEVFIHGAMCICYSGQCHLSREIGGRSGNRGVCAQPCRMKYEAKGSSAYFLSPKDLSTIHYLKEISEAGVKSLKIEGRMKSPEYVAVVCKTYRKYLDEYAENGNYSVSQEDERSLAQIFNRGNFTSAYYFGKNDKGLMSKELPKHQGIYIGKALSKVSETLVDVQLKKGEVLEIGDGVEFRNSALAGNVISYCKKNKDGSFRIGDIRGKVAKGDSLYKISDKAQLEEVRRNISLAEKGKHSRKSELEMYLQIKEGELPKLEIINGKHKVKVFGKTAAEKALKLAITKEKALAQLLKLGDTAFDCSNAVCEVQEGVSIPISVLNEMRREAVRKLVELKQGKREVKGININTDTEAYIHLENEKFEFYFHEFSKVQQDECLELADKIFVPQAEKKWEATLVLPIYDLMEKMEEVEEFKDELARRAKVCVNIIPYIFHISKGKLDEYLKKNEEGIVKIAEKNGIYVGNLGSVKFLQNRKVKMFGDYGLNIINYQGIEFAKDLNINKLCLSHEINKHVYGKIPLMISEHIFDEKLISDKKHREYEIKYISKIDKTLIYEKKSNLEILKEIQDKNCFRIYL